jgi:hypothetical protein
MIVLLLISDRLCRRDIYYCWSRRCYIHRYKIGLGNDTPFTSSVLTKLATIGISCTTHWLQLFVELLPIRHPCSILWCLTLHYVIFIRISVSACCETRNSSTNTTENAVLLLGRELKLNSGFTCWGLLMWECKNQILSHINKISLNSNIQGLKMSLLSVQVDCVNWCMNW